LGKGSLRNQPCICGSGKKYKNCCMGSEPPRARESLKYKHYRVEVDPGEAKDSSPLSLKLHSITGYYANDYVKPVVRLGGSILHILSDESRIEDTFCVSMIFFEPIHEQITMTEKKLRALVQNYGLERIHFNELIGRKKLLGDKTNEFLSSYKSILLGAPPMSCMARFLTKDDAITLGLEADEEIYFTLFWNAIQDIIDTFPPYCIIHIYTEQDGSVTNSDGSYSREYGERLIAKLYSGLQQMPHYTSKYFSICKHPRTFTKEMLLWSSLADLVAYGTNKIVFRQQRGVPDSKILKQADSELMMSLLKEIFVNYSGLPIRDLVRQV
jgi:hypothetical protein